MTVAAKTKKVTSKAKVANLKGGLTKRDITNIGKKSNEMKEAGVSEKERIKAAGDEARRIKIDRAKDDEVITLEGLSTLTLRIREYKREGLSNVAIGARVGVSESTVRRRLKTPLTEEETLLEGMLDELSNTRDEIIEKFMHNPRFARVFKDDGNWILRTHTIKRRASFSRREGRGHRMSFTLEFSAYRQPTKPLES